MIQLQTLQINCGTKEVSELRAFIPYLSPRTLCLLIVCLEMYFYNFCNSTAKLGSFSKVPVEGEKIRKMYRNS